MNIFTRFFSNNVNKTDAFNAELMRRESAIGRELFGPIPAGVKREFFCLDENTWVWHEEKNGQTKVTKYLVKDVQILKSINGGQYHKISNEEAKHLAEAAKIYKERVNNSLYNLPK